MVTISSGLAGGLIATIVMTIVMMGLQRVRRQDTPTPTQLFWAKYVGDGPPEAYAMPGMVLHLGYGIVAGGVFVGLVPVVGVSLGTLTAALLWGLVWGLVLFVFGAGFWLMVVLDVSPSAGLVIPLLAVHLVYGLVLAGWLVVVPSI